MFSWRPGSPAREHMGFILLSCFLGPHSSHLRALHTPWWTCNDVTMAPHHEHIFVFFYNRKVNTGNQEMHRIGTAWDQNPLENSFLLHFPLHISGWRCQELSVVFHTYPQKFLAELQDLAKRVQVWDKAQRILVPFFLLKCTGKR